MLNVLLNCINRLYMELRKKYKIDDLKTLHRGKLRMKVNRMDFFTVLTAISSKLLRSKFTS